MHTFFVNTSKRIDPARHSPLFDNLVSQNQLKIINCGLDELDTCAERISDMITRSEEMTEQYNIIVYTEISERNETALAIEKAASLHIEESLFSALYALGRKANQALILFGENFTRDVEYARGHEYNKNVRSVLWNLFPLPEENKARSILRDVQEKYGRMTDDNLQDFRRTAWLRLVEEKQESSLLSAQSDFVVSTMYELVETVGNSNPEEIDLQEQLYHAVNNQRVHVQKQVTVDKVKYAHVRLHDSDFHATNRTEYQVLLFVYSCASSERIALVENSSDEGDRYENAASIGAGTIPEVNWDVLATLLKKKRWTFEQELQQIELTDERFPRFREELLFNPKIIPVSAEPPELLVHIHMHRGLTVGRLRRAVDDTLTEIETKSSENKTRIKNYITRITDIFSSEKDSKMKNISIKLEENWIESDQLTEDYIRLQRDRADAKVAAQKHLTIPSGDVDDLLKDARIHTEYYFDCLKKGWLIYAAGAAFMLLMLLPYAVLQADALFGTAVGWACFIGSAVLFGLVFTGSCLLFTQVYKGKIIRELRQLSDRFTASQKEKQDCLNQYIELISHSIPLSFCLRTYETEFEAYRKRKKTIPFFITGHSKLLRRYIQYVGNLLQELEITFLGQEPEPSEHYNSAIALDRDQYQNNILYSIVDDQTVQSCFKEKNGGAKWSN